MSVSSGGRRPSKKLSPELKWEILKIVSGEVTQSDAARKNGVDVSRIIALRRSVKDVSLVALSRAPGRPRVERNFELEAARTEIGAVDRGDEVDGDRVSDRAGKSELGLVGLLPARSPPT